MIQVLERCFAVLDLLREGEKTLTELSRATAVQKTTLRNILRTLEELDVVARSGKRYILGPKVLWLAQAAPAPDAAAPDAAAPDAAAPRDVAPRAAAPEPQAPKASQELREAAPEESAAEPAPVAETRRGWAGFRS